MLYVRGNIVDTLDVPAVSVQDGLESTPSIKFANAATSGMYMPGGGAIGISVGGVEKLRISSSGISTTANVSAPYFFGNGAHLTGLSVLNIANVQITDSSWTPLAATAISNTGGYCVVNGSGFVGTVNALVGASVVPSALTVASSSQLRLSLPAMDNGTYPVWVFSDQYSYAKPSALTVSPLPIWSTSSTLANVIKYTEFTQSLVATEPLSSNITYTLASGSSLPPAVSLTSLGVLSGNILTDPDNTTTYSFVIEASDEQYQKIPRTFGLTALRVFAATGGTVTYAEGYTIHTFTTSGTFTVTLNPAAASVEYLIIAGGGGGGQSGGGGAGGLIEGTYSIAASSYSVVIGGGGNGSSGAARGANGSNTTFLGLTAIGGGGGGGNSGSASGTGADGGSGGGGGAAGGVTMPGGAGLQPGSASGGYGNGGGSSSNGQPPYPGGGGGGAGSAGGTASTTVGGAAGIGRYSSISGTSIGYAGGGAGQCFSANNPGAAQTLFGGGAGVTTADNGNGTNGRGGGGGGYGGGGGTVGGNGGSGIAVIRYAT